MTTTTINYKSAAPVSPTSAIIVNGGDADNTDVTDNATGRFTVFYGDKAATGDVITSPTTVVNGSGATPPDLPTSGLNGGPATGADTIQIRRDLATNWQTVNPALLSGELGFATDAKTLKVGPGHWNDLPNILECAYKAALVGNCVTINAATHGQGTRPQIEVYTPSGAEVSVAVSVDSIGTIEIASNVDLTGHTAVIRA